MGILETTHFKVGEDIYTKGKYKVIKILNDDDVYFDGYEIIKTIHNS